MNKKISTTLGITVLIVLVIIVVGIITWQYYLLPSKNIEIMEIEGEKTKIASGNLTLKTSDGSTLEIYDVNNNSLIKTISKEEIDSKFLEKYGDLLIEKINDSREPDFPSVSWQDLGDLEEGKDFIYDAERNRFIIAGVYSQYRDKYKIWDFFIFNVEDMDFSIVPGERSHLQLLPEKIPAGFLPVHFVLSPDNRYLAYAIHYIGGTCMAQSRPYILDLDTFQGKDLSDTPLFWSALATELEKIEKNDYSSIKKDRYISGPYFIRDIKWSSDDLIKVNMEFLYEACYKGAKDIRLEIEFSLSKVIYDFNIEAEAKIIEEEIKIDDPKEITQDKTEEITEIDDPKEITQDKKDNECSIIKVATGVDFPCQYFVPTKKLPKGYNIYFSEEEGGYGVYEVPSHDTFGPSKEIKVQYSIVYSKGERTPMGIPGFSLNVLIFNEGYDKSENIKRVDEISEQIKEEMGVGIEYLIRENDLLIILPGPKATQSEILYFENSLQQLLK